MTGMRVVATAGHVDHGKSTLVKSLTGTDPDRWAEEKERGLTIDLGFAVATLASGNQIGFVDVPGHVRFLKNMIAGVGAVDACLFVVAATEGWKPQSEEHLRILEMVGVRHGLVALTKVAGLDREWREIARLELADRLAGTFLEDADVIEVDVLAGEGTDQLRMGLDRLAAATPPAADLGRPRLWVDRSFAAKGSGTVCTGTLAGGKLAVEDEIDIVTAKRINRGRIRALQSHGIAGVAMGPGRRVAVNIAGVSYRDIARGDAVVHLDQWAPTTVVDASLEILASLDHEVSRRGAYQAYIGSGEHPVRLRVLGSASIEPGGKGFVRLWLGRALPLLPRDRYVLREAGRAETVGGGEILDVAPVVRASLARPDLRPERVVAERGWIEAEMLERLTGVRLSPQVAGRWVAEPNALAELARSLVQRVKARGDHGLDLASLEEFPRAVLVGAEGVEIRDGVAYEAGRPTRDLHNHPLLVEMQKAPFSPPQPQPGERADARALVKAGLAVDCDGYFFAASAVAQAIDTIEALLQSYPQGLTVAQIRDALGTSRKFLLPLLAHLDATGITRRRGDLRTAGARMPSAGS